MGCGCAATCSTLCACDCHAFTSPLAAAQAGARFSSLWDRARDLKARAGLRPYRVTIVRARSAGGRARGDGPTEVIREWTILPIPMVGDLTAISEVLSADQLREAGSVMLSEVSTTYRETVLLGRGEDGAPIPVGETVYYEVCHLDAQGRVTVRRKFVRASAPYLKASTAEWMIMLTRAPWESAR